MSFESSRSANSKRSFNSNCSNNSNSEKKKKKKSGQKTLGVAWGSNSLSSSRSCFRSSPFSSFGSYMVEKNRKLHNQFDAEASSSSQGGSSSERPIFQGVSIFVDGFTVPSSQELRGYMFKYGGRFENYFSKRCVTHIICSNLPDSKIKNLRSFSRGLPVVKPMWILDSVAANRLLSWVPYQLDQLTASQPKLSAFFAPRRSLVAEEALINKICQLKPGGDYLSSKEVTSEDAYSSEARESFEKRRPVVNEFDGVCLERNTAIMPEKPISSEASPEEPSDFAVEHREVVNNELQTSIQQVSASFSSTFHENGVNKDVPTSTVVGPSRRQHSTLEDPDFVENYFKNSRLHFIGTWRNRYRKRFPSSSYRGSWSGQNICANLRKTVIIHIDMDCFFVSVVIRNRPELQEKPVAVCHSDNPKGTAEISSANYPARAYGVKAGMFVRDAKALCPHLVIVPYNFEAYEAVADQFYDILHKHCGKVQAVSCDEAFLDITDLEVEDPEFLASTIRKEIFETTRCSASAGIAENMLMARLATRTAKPDGQFYIPAEKVDEHLDRLPISALPGIGHVLEHKLKERNIETCGKLRMISKDSLQKDIGMKTGEMLWNYSRGLDHRLVGVIQESKSICAEVNWGVRFKEKQDTQHFLLSLCKEVSFRLQGCGVLGRTFTLKVKKRRKDAGEPVKYMGCGACENLSRSSTVPVATDDVEVLQRITKRLFGSFHLDVKDIRGVGLQVSKLESADASKKGSENNSLKTWLTSASAKTEEQDNVGSITKHTASSDYERHAAVGDCGLSISDQAEVSVRMDDHRSNSENQVSSLPPLCHLDVGIVECLPTELLSELNETYGGSLVEFIERNSSKNYANSKFSHDASEDASMKGKESLLSDRYHMNAIVQAKKQTAEECHPVPISSAGTSSEAIPNSDLEMGNVMPLSLSQVDMSVLQELPEELRADILEVLPAHRKRGSSLDASLGSYTEDMQDVEGTKNKATFSDNNLWIGNPPQWVETFKVSCSCILKRFSEVYLKARPSPSLSSILQHCFSERIDSEDTISDGWDEAVYNICELFRQYVKLKIEVDIEEIYICLRVLKRLSARSKIYQQVYDVIFPYLQALVGENYGGSLLMS